MSLGQRKGGLMAPIKGGNPNKSKIMLPANEKNPVANILKKNAKNIKKSKRGKNSKLNKSKSLPAKTGKIGGRKGGGKKQLPSKRRGAKRKKGKNNKSKNKKNKKESNKEKQQEKEEELEEKKEEEIDPYIKLKSTDSSILIRMFLHKLISYPFVCANLGQFGDQLQSAMINFSNDMILPQLMSADNIFKFQSIINDRKLIYLLRQSFIRWLLIHKNQIKLLFKRKGDENANNKLKYDIIVTKNNIISKLSNTLTNNSNDLKDIINKMDIKTKLKYFHYLKSDIKNPFLAQLMTPIPQKLLSNTKCNVPSLSGNMPNINEQKNDPQAIINGIVNHETKEEEQKMDELKEENGNGLMLEQKEEQKTEKVEFDNVLVQNKLNKLFDGYKDCVLLSEKQMLFDILKTQYKLIQNAIDDYGKIRWMDAPIDHGHVRLMQRELIRDHELIIKKCRAIENDYKKKLLSNINEVNKMRNELNKRKNIYLNLIDNKCYQFLKQKLSQIHEEIERKKQAIALHEKKRENYLNHAKESLKNEQNMRKGVKLVNDTYHKYLRQLARSKIEYAVIDNKLTQEQFYRLQEKLNNLRNKNDRYWYWYKKEREIYTKSIKTFSRMNRFFKKIEEFLIAEYGENSKELIMFRSDYYLHVLKNNVHKNELDNEFNKEIFDKKKISDIEIVYNMNKKDIKLPAAEPSIVNRLYKQLKPNDLGVGLMNGTHERNKTNDQTGMFLNNAINKHQQAEEEVEEQEEYKEVGGSNEHINDSDEEEVVEDDEEHKGYTKTNDDEIFANVKIGHEEKEDEDEEQYGHREEEYGQYDEEYGHDEQQYHQNEEQYYDHEEDNDNDNNEEDMTYEEVIQQASNARSSGKLSSTNIRETEEEEVEEEEEEDKDETDSEKEDEDEYSDDMYDINNTKGTQSQFLITAKASNKRGKRNTQNVWKGKMESTIFYNDGDDANKNITAGPHIDKHYKSNYNATDDTFEDSTQYHDDDEDEQEYIDPNRPSSTIFKNEPTESPQFFKEPEFFPENKNNSTELKEEVEPEDEEEEEDGYEHRIKISTNKHEKAQNSVSVSGFGDIGASYEYDNDNNEFDVPPPPPPNDNDNDDEDEYDENDFGNDLVSPPPPPNDNNNNDEESDDQFDDNMENNLINDEDMGNMSFESDEEDDSSYESDESSD